MKSIDSACRSHLVFNWLQYYVPKHGPTSYLLIYTTAPSSFIRLSKKMRGKWNAQWFRIAVETVNTVRKQMDKADIWIITRRYGDRVIAILSGKTLLLSCIAWRPVATWWSGADQSIPGLQILISIDQTNHTQVSTSGTTQQHPGLGNQLFTG